ncbi:MAG: hypothetical protein P8Y92_08425 [Halioglobus sp.]|jgi:hypothetical protein
MTDRANDRPAREAARNDKSPRRQGRRYAVSSQRGKSSSKIRYIEGTTPASGCRFL